MITATLYPADDGPACPCDPHDADLGPGKDGDVMWVDVVDTTEDEAHIVEHAFGIHHLAGEVFLDGTQRARLDPYPGHFVLVARDVSFAERRIATREVDVLFGDGWVVTVRHRPAGGGEPFDLDPVVKRFDRVRDGHGSTSTGYLVYVLMDVIVDRAFDVVDEIDDCLEEIQDEIFDTHDDGRRSQRSLLQLRKALMVFRRAVSPMREVLSAVLRREVPEFDDELLTHFQDVYDHVLRAVDFNEGQREMLAAILDAELSVQSNQMNKVMKLMTSWGAILLGASLIAGIYGMNFDDIPLRDNPHGFWLAIGSMAVLTIGLWWVFRKRRWL